MTEERQMLHLSSKRARIISLGSTGWSASLCFLEKHGTNPLRSCFRAHEGKGHEHKHEQDHSAWT